MARSEIFHFQLPALPVADALTQMGPEQEKVALAALADMAYAVWQKLAAERLHTSRRTYQAAIEQPEILPGYAVVALTGAAANAIEHGSRGYDMRTTLLGPNVPVVPVRSGQRGKHRSKSGGFFRAIPFSHQGPTGQGATGAPLGSAHHEQLGSAASLALGKRIQASASRLKPTLEGPNRTMQYGGRLKAGLAPKLRPHHTTSIYTGMVRVGKDYANEKTGRVTRQYSLRTWRMISTNVMRGWMRRATPGIHLLEEVRAHMAREAPAYLALHMSTAKPVGQP